MNKEYLNLRGPAEIQLLTAFLNNNEFVWYGHTAKSVDTIWANALYLFYYAKIFVKCCGGCSKIHVYDVYALLIYCLILRRPFWFYNVLVTLLWSSNTLLKTVLLYVFIFFYLATKIKQLKYVHCWNCHFQLLMAAILNFKMAAKIASESRVHIS